MKRNISLGYHPLHFFNQFQSVGPRKRPQVFSAPISFQGYRAADDVEKIRKAKTISEMSHAGINPQHFLKDLQERSTSKDSINTSGLLSTFGLSLPNTNVEGKDLVRSEDIMSKILLQNLFLGNLNRYQIRNAQEAQWFLAAQKAMEDLINKEARSVELAGKPADLQEINSERANAVRRDQEQANDLLHNTHPVQQRLEVQNIADTFNQATTRIGVQPMKNLVNPNGKSAEEKNKAIELTRDEIEHRFNEPYKTMTGEDRSKKELDDATMRNKSYNLTPYEKPFSYDEEEEEDETIPVIQSVGTSLQPGPGYSGVLQIPVNSGDDIRKNIVPPPSATFNTSTVNTAVKTELPITKVVISPEESVKTESVLDISKANEKSKVKAEEIASSDKNKRKINVTPGLNGLADIPHTEDVIMKQKHLPTIPSLLNATVFAVKTKLDDLMEWDAAAANYIFAMLIKLVAELFNVKPIINELPADVQNKIKQLVHRIIGLNQTSFYSKFMPRLQKAQISDKYLSDVRNFLSSKRDSITPDLYNLVNIWNPLDVNTKTIMSNELSSLFLPTTTY